MFGHRHWTATSWNVVLLLYRSYIDQEMWFVFCMECVFCWSESSKDSQSLISLPVFTPCLLLLNIKSSWYKFYYVISLCLILTFFSNSSQKGTFMCQTSILNFFPFKPYSVFPSNHFNPGIRSILYCINSINRMRICERLVFSRHTINYSNHLSC